MEKYRKRKTARILQWNPWNWEAESGDIMISLQGKAYRLEPSSGWNKRCAGELYPRKIKCPTGFNRAIIKNGEMYWIKESPDEQ